MGATTRAAISSFLILSGVFAYGQDAPPPDLSDPSQPPQQLMSPQELDNLVAPVALYPDSVLGQVLAASTYPLEIVEAQQWLQQNANLQGSQRVDAARQQNWDPSVQALAAFPDVLTLLNRDIRWTTDLGNAFLNQQADVMAAIQRMRGRARNNGRLENTPQQRITTETQDGQTDIQIQPADPQVVYVPAYNPAYVWGPPAWGSYPALWYPSFGFGFGPAAFLGSLFSGFLGFGGWGWGLNWLAHGLFFNGLFFNHFGYHGYGGNYAGMHAWTHDPGHRLGVPYPNRALAGRYGNTRGFSSSANRGFQGGYRAPAANNYRGSSSYGGQRMSEGYRGEGQSAHYAAPRAPAQNYAARNYSERNYAAPQRYSQQQHFSQPQHESEPRRASGPHQSAPRSSGGHGSAPHGSGHHSSGGHSGGGGHKH